MISVEDFLVDEWNKKWWVALGVILVGGLALLLLDFSRGVERGEKPEQVAGSGRERLSAMKNSLGSALPRRKVTIEPAEPVERKFDPYEEWETAKILEHFGIPSAKFEGESMAEVVDLIREMFEEFGGKNVEFQIVGGVDSGFPVVADVDENISLRSLLDLVAGLGGYDLELAEGLVTFRRKQAAFDDDQQVTLRLAAQTEALKVSREVEDPFADPQEPEPMASPEEWLSKYGIQFEAGTGIETDPETGEWVLTNTGAELARIRAVYEFAAAKVPGSLPGGTVFFEIKNVGEEGGTEFEAHTFADASEFDEAMRGLGAGANVNSAPSVFAHAGQRARIETGSQVVYPVEFDKSGTPTSFETGMVGFSTELDARVAGLDQVMMTGYTEYTTLGETELKDGFQQAVSEGGKSPQLLSEQDFVARRTDFEGVVFDGNMVGFSAARDKTSNLLQFISVRRMMPDGTPLLPE